MLYIKLFIEREKNIGQSAPECPFKDFTKEEARCRRCRDVGCGERGWAFSRKKSCLPPSDKFGCILIFDADFNSRKHGQSLEALHATRILRFNRETKFTKQCKDYPKIHGLTTIAPPPPKYATD